MRWQIKAEIAGETGRKTTIELPISDEGMARALCRLLQGPLDTQVTITGIEPGELASLCGEGRDLDELNYLAKRMDGLWEPEMDKFLAVMEAHRPQTVREAINTICNLDCYSLIDESRSLSDTGRQFIMDRDGGMPDDEYQHGDFGEAGQKLLDRGDGRKTSHGMLYSTGNDFYTDYKGTIFPEYLYESKVFDIWLEHGENTEVLQLPCDDLAIDKALRRLGAGSLDECRIERMDCWPVSYDWLEKLCPEIEADDLRELNRLAELCRRYEAYDYQKLAAVMEYAQRSSLELAITAAQNIRAFHFVPDVSSERGLGEFMIKESGVYYHDKRLDRYLDYDRFGRDLTVSESGTFIEGKGYIGVFNGTPVDEILGEEELSGDISFGEIQ